MANSRRDFLKQSGIVGAGLLAGSTIGSAAPTEPGARTNSGQLSGGGGVLVQTPDLPKLPWVMDGEVKVFRLIAEVVKTKINPMKEIYAWGFNGSVPGPTIEVNEGDRVRILFENKLPEATTVHWHGLEVPLAMDGVPFISQPLVESGGTYTYEFSVYQNGTFFYHSHMAMQEMMGMIGFFVIHPKEPESPHCHKDFGLILQEWALLPNNPVPNSLAMEFNWLTMNGKAGPATTPLIVKQGERVRIRLVNLGMDHHPIHLHGHQFYVTGTEAGRIPESRWFRENTVLVGVAQARNIEFEAVYPGDWMIHCHLPHHMMNQMVSMVGPMGQAGHGVPTGRGMEEGMGVVRQGNALSDGLAPGFGRGMGDTTENEQNTSTLVGPSPHAQQNGVSNVDPKRVPGYPQDMVMIMDREVAKPETYGLSPGWTASMMGMMTLVRVFTPAMYDEVMRRIREGIIEMPAAMPGHKHGG